MTHSLGSSRAVLVYDLLWTPRFKLLISVPLRDAHGNGKVGPLVFGILYPSELCIVNVHVNVYKRIQTKNKSRQDSAGTVRYSRCCIAVKEYYNIRPILNSRIIARII